MAKEVSVERKRYEVYKDKKRYKKEIGFSKWRACLRVVPFWRVVTATYIVEPDHV